MSNCLNCGVELGSSIYCSNCGQKSSTKRLVTFDVLTEAWESFTSIDNRWYQTFVGLIRSPGSLTTDYVEGKRKRFAGPLQYFIVVFALVVLIGSPTADITGTNVSPDDLDDSFSLFGWIAIAIQNYFVAYILLLSPIATLMLHIALYGRGRSFAESLVFTLYQISQIALFLLVLFQLNSVFLFDDFGLFLVMIVLGPISLYTSWALGLFYKIGLVRAFLTGFVVIVIYMGLIPIVYLLIVLAATISSSA